MLFIKVSQHIPEITKLHWKLKRNASSRISESRGEFSFPWKFPQVKSESIPTSPEKLCMYFPRDKKVFLQQERRTINYYKPWNSSKNYGNYNSPGCSSVLENSAEAKGKFYRQEYRSYKRNSRGKLTAKAEQLSSAQNTAPQYRSFSISMENNRPRQLLLPC